MKFFRMWIPVIALFVVAAFGLTGCGGGGGTSTPEPAPGAAGPTAPTNVTATPGNGQVSIGWTTVSGATSYNIYWSTTPGVTKESNPIFDAANPYLHAGLAGGTTYYYVVTAVNSTGESVASAEKSATTPLLAPAPTGVSATPADGKVTIAWTAVPNATAYNIYWDTTPGVTTGTGTKIPGATNPYVDNVANDGTVYYYLVTAVVGGVESAPSPEVSAKPSATPAPASPSGVTATTFNMSGINQINIAWTAVPGATSYNIYWSVFPGVTTGNGTMISNETTPFAHQGLNSGTYYYIVTAVNANGESTTSPEVIAVPAIFTSAMLSGKTVVDKNLGGGTFTFVCSATGTLTYTSTVSGMASSGTGTWTVEPDGSLLITVTPGARTFTIFSIVSNSLGVTYTVGSDTQTQGPDVLTIN
jgi:fibronectin type 3 domain-containing protein